MTALFIKQRIIIYNEQSAYIQKNRVGVVIGGGGADVFFV